MNIKRGRDGVRQDGPPQVRARCTEWRPPVEKGKRTGPQKEPQERKKGMVNAPTTCAPRRADEGVSK